MLVGDNPFHGVSHLSQERAKVRSKTVTDPKHAADLVMLSLENGADGFMFSVSETTLSILKIIDTKWKNNHISLHAITPNAYQSARVSGQLGMSGMVSKLAKQMITSGNMSAIISCLTGVAKTDAASLMKGFLFNEIAKIKSSSRKRGKLDSVYLHEVVCDMGIALNLRWLFDMHINLMLDQKIKPGFETRNFAFLVSRFREWNLNLDKVMISAPFNAVGYQMAPSKEKCERELDSLSVSNVVAINVLASGYLDLQTAAEYIRDLPHLHGFAIGISKETHAQTTFKLFRKVCEKQ